MAEDATTETYSCSFCDSHHTHLEFSQHKVSNAHLKKVKKQLFQRGFSSVCLVCNSGLKDLKHLELHVQEKKHTERLTLMNSLLSSEKCTCVSCGISFFNEVVLEAHRLLHLHDLEASPPDTPKLNELCKQLSGLCGTRFLSNGCRLCYVCNVTFVDIQESIMHLFTPAHMAQLRASFCMVCKKNFVHVSDREAHLTSGKHSLAIRKCRNFLEEGDTQTLLRKGGYLCMFCMVWCNSWVCLEMHILERHHNKVVAHRKAPSNIIFLTGSEGSEVAPSCNDSVKSSWKEWIGEALEDCIWCHRCGLTLSGIDEANEHLNTHNIESCRARRELHSVVVFGVAQLPKIFECSVCAMSFKSGFMLSAHTASLEHHRRLVAFSLSNTLYCCSSCGLLVKNVRDGDGVSFCKNLRGSSHQVKDVEAGLLHPVKKVKAGPLHPAKDIKAGSLHPAKDPQAILTCLKLPSADSHLVDNDRSVGIKTEVPTLDAANDNIADGNAIQLCQAEANALMAGGANDSGLSKVNLQEVSMDQTSHPNGVVYVKDACFGDLGVPIVVGATLVPLKNLQESLQSITTIVTETFSSLLPSFFVQQPTPSHVKRKSEGNIDETVDQAHLKRFCGGKRALEAALQQGLRSVSANATKLENAKPRLENCAREDKEMQEPRAVVAVTASVIPSGMPDLSTCANVTASVIPSGMPDLSTCANEQDQAIATKAQESSAMQSVDNTSKQAQESATVKSESLSRVVVGNQVVAERTIADQVVEEVRAQAGMVHLQPGGALACPDNHIQSSALSPLAKDSVKEEESLQSRKLATPPLKAASHNSKSESNDDDDEDEGIEEDDYSFLDPKKGQGAWWACSDSDDSDSI